MLTELILDNRKIIDRISSEQVSLFVQRLVVTKDPCFMDLLAALCVCNGLPISRNQSLVCDLWLKNTVC